MPFDWLVELAAVALGVYLALWAQRRLEWHRDRQLEAAYLGTLLEDLDQDLSGMRAMRERIDGYAAAIREVLGLLEGEQAVAPKPRTLRLAAVINSLHGEVPPDNNHNGRTPRNGALRVVRRREKVRAVLAFHRRVEDAYLSYHFLWRKMIDHLWPTLKEVVEPDLFPGAMAKLYSADYSLEDPYGPGATGLIEGESDGTAASAQAGSALEIDLEELRAHPRLRSALLDQLETLVVIRGELQLYEGLCQDARSIVAAGT